jgi:stearoyl-CoA desaturase (delta-9 desaturase)
MINSIHQIHKFRVLYALGWGSLIFTIAYAIMYNAWWLLLASYLWSRVVSFLGIQIGLHRYFSHKSFKTTKLKHKFLLWFSILGGEGSPISWSMQHRHHHKNSEGKLDLHSPYESKLLSMFLWQIKPLSWWLNDKQLRTMPRDLLKDSEIRFVDKHYYNIWLILIVATLLISWKITVFFLLSTVGWALFHAIWVNYISHTRFPGSYRNFETSDSSYNNQWVAWYLGGEGLHNNHHQFPSNYSQAVKDHEFDFGGFVVGKFFKLAD